MKWVMAVKNCWEIINCGRGLDNQELDPEDLCPAALDESSDNINRGKNGGRFCWELAGTLCAGKVQGELATKIETCFDCKFFKMVVEEEGSDFVLHSDELVKS